MKGARHDEPEAMDDVPDLGSFIRQHEKAILEAWEASVRHLPPARDLSRRALLDHVPRLLERIAELADAADRPSEPPTPTAELHAIARLAEGFDLPEVLREYGVLRDCILQLWEQSVQPEHHKAGLRVLHRAIDRAMEASVDQYTRARDHAIRALDRISVVALEARDLDEFLDRLLAVLVETTPSVDAALVMLVDGDVLRTCAAVGLAEGSKGFQTPIGEGFAGTVATERRPSSIRSAETDDRVLNTSLREQGIRALHGAPLLERGELLGVALIGSRTAYEFSEQDRRLLGTMASRAGSAIALHRLRASLQARTEQQEAVTELGLQAITTSDVTQLMDAAVAAVTRVLDVELAKILELDASGEVFILRAARGFRQELLGKPVVSEGKGSLGGYTIAAGEPVIVEDLRTERRFRAPPLLIEYGVVSAISVIINAPGPSGRPWGVLGACSREARSFSAEDIAFLQSAANVVAHAILRAGSEDALKRAVARERFLADTSRQLAESLDYKTTLEKVARLAVPQIADWCVVDVVQPDGALRRVSIAHVDPARQRIAEKLTRDYPPDPERSVLHRVVREGRSILVPDIPDTHLIEEARDEEHLRIMRMLEPRSYLVAPVQSRDRVLGTIAMMTAESGRRFDETDLALAEELARRAAVAIENAALYRQAQDAVRVREDVLAVVSHDLRNPLGAIEMASSLLSDRLRRSGADVRYRKQLETIQRSVRRMDRLIGDLLDIASIGSGRLSVELGRHDLLPIVSEAADAQQPVADERGILLRRELPGGPIVITADRERILQVLANVLDNALKFSEPGGAVTVRVERDPDQARIVIADEGAGIPPEQLPHIFDAYWTSKKRGKGGTGLGLYIAKGMIEAHGGRIEATSEVGEGSTFVIALPLAP